jgi:RecG-like helicase
VGDGQSRPCLAGRRKTRNKGEKHENYEVIHCGSRRSGAAGRRECRLRKADEADAAKTITGEVKCAKCLLKEKTDTHQTAIQVKEGDKTVTYYLVANDVIKKYDKNVCEKSEKVTATGTVKTVDGKLQLTATKIEPAK